MGIVRAFPPTWDFDTNKNTVYASVIAVPMEDVRRMVFFADSFLNGNDVMFYWGAPRIHDHNVKRNISINGVWVQISISHTAHCLISILGEPDETGIATGPALWSENLDTKATSFDHLCAIARGKLIEHLQMGE